jgi:glycosyltransferase involved in cell wall biosynthesis
MVAAPPSRNSPCPCGSGRRGKHCCFRLGEAQPASSGAPPRSSTIAQTIEPVAARTKHRALDAQLAGQFPQALHLYETALAQTPTDFDALHMRAVTLYQMGCFEEARAAFAMLLRVHNDVPAAAWKNAGLVLGNLLGMPDDTDNAALRNRYAAWQHEVGRALGNHANVTANAATHNARIAVVIASYNHARYIDAAIESVFAQTRLPRELIVIDDGSSDDTVNVAKAALSRAPHGIEVKLIARENRGAATSFNEAIDAASSDWIAPLNSDDAFSTTRIETLSNTIAPLARFGVEWMFGGVRFIDAVGTELAPTSSARAIGIWQAHNSFRMADGVGLSLLRANCTVSTGNHFFKKTLWQQLGGYRELRYNHDWDFALRAACLSEPVFVDRAHYLYRLHESNTIAESASRPMQEAYALIHSFLNDARIRIVNPFAPVEPCWRKLFWAMLAGAGQLEHLSSPQWQRIAAFLAANDPIVAQTRPLSAPRDILTSQPQSNVAVAIHA